eukprot:SAG22_NODE_994_length_6119_cov_167.397674_7_plen_312_part_00
MGQQRKLRAAIIGAGGRARGSHYVCVSYLKDQVELVAMCELDPELMGEVAAEFGIPQTYADHTQLLAELASTLDIVYVIMNERYLLRPALDCIEAGCNIMIEKPVGSSGDEARQLLAAAERKGVTLAVGVQRRFTNVVQEAMRVVATTGAPPTMAAGTFNKMLLGGTGQDAAGAYGAPKSAASKLAPLTPDRRVPSVTTTLWNDGIHIVDTVRYMCGGEVVAVECGAAAVGGSSFNLYTARVTFDNGAVGMITANRAAGGRVLRAELHGQWASLLVWGAAVPLIASPSLSLSLSRWVGLALFCPTVFTAYM